MSNHKNQFIMLPKVDFCFKELMKNSKVRNGFISALLQKPVTELQSSIRIDPNLSKEEKKDKLGILDVRILLQDGTQIDMEMQVAYFADWDKRIIFYISKMYIEPIRSGEAYDVLKKCIHVSILDFNHFDDDCCYRTINFRDDVHGDIYSDMLEIKILELQKLEKNLQNTGTGTVYDWMKFFNGKNKEDFEIMAKENEYFEEGYHELMELSADDEKRREYEAREKALRDFNSQMNNARKEGEEIGQKKGEEIGQKRGEEIGQKRGEEIGQKRGEELVTKVFKLFMKGISEEEIAKQCGVSAEKVRALLK